MVTTVPTSTGEAETASAWIVGAGFTARTTD
jgi:hypothetical protein